MVWLFWGFLILIVFGVFISIRTNKLTTGGAVSGGVIATIILYGTGAMNVVLLAVYFILATVATTWKNKKKKPFKPQSTRRDAWQVIANGGLAGLFGLAAVLFPQHLSLLILLMAASLSSAIADTLSSELGTLYGKKFVNILTWKKDKKGLDGVISLEGTLFGLAGSLILAILYSWVSGWTLYSTIIVIAGTAGNLMDSVLGAALERKGFIGNNLVNFLNTLTAALFAFLLLQAL